MAKRPAGGATCESSVRSKHRKTIDPRWASDFPWMVIVDSEGEGMLCVLINFFLIVQIYQPHNPRSAINLLQLDVCTKLLLYTIVPFIVLPGKRKPFLNDDLSDYFKPKQSKRCLKKK